MIARPAFGFLAAALVALAAWRAGSLSRSGAVAAALVGTAAVTAGWAWGALLVLYFLTSSALSHLGATEKERRTGGVVAKGGARDAMQVLANGGVFAVCVLALAARPSMAGTFAAAAAGALSAAAADTWATEVGVLAGRTPRSILGFRPVPTGTSGAMSVPGTLAMLGGALFVAIVARLLHATPGLITITLAGCAGAIADTLLGATLQERRWCDVCHRGTERRVHDCGAGTRRVAGLGVLDNDVVNLLATLVGAATAALLAFRT